MVEEIKIPIEFARAICDMASTCWDEGRTGTNEIPLLRWIANNHPSLINEFDYLPWDWFKTATPKQVLSSRIALQELVDEAQELDMGY